MKEEENIRNKGSAHTHLYNHTEIKVKKPKADEKAT